MKKQVIIRSLIWVAVAMLWLSSCTTSGKTQKTELTNEHEELVKDLDLDKIRERGYITAIMDNSSTGLFIYRGQTMGYEYELVKRFAKSLGVALRIDITPNLEEGFRKLNSGEGDILAYNLTITKERKKRIAFTHYHNQVRMVLIQRKPENWRELKQHEIEKSLIRNPVDLIGKEVIVRSHSAYADRLHNLSDEIGGDIIITQADPEVETEAIIKRVADGEIDYTVAEEDVALVNASYYPNLDIQTAISFPTQIAWGVRKNATNLLDTLNDWILKMRQTSDYYTIYNKYYRSTKSALMRTQSDYSSLGGGNLSPYDDLIKESADALGWDWKLLAAQIFKESKFKSSAESWAGAVGLLQLLPATAEKYGVYVTDLSDPAENLKAGTAHLKWLQDFFSEIIEDPQERIKFVLAAYNAGHGHIMDAIRLTEKYGGNPQKWDGEVAEYLMKKTSSKFYNDPIVVYGYCRGDEPVNYVKSVYSIYHNYETVLPDDQKDSAMMISQNGRPESSRKKG